MKSKPISKLNEIHPTVCPIVAQVRRQYRIHRFYYDYGYICYILPDGVKKLEHRLVASALGELSADHDVHHIDGNRTHNAATNLYPCTPSEHSKIHNPTTGQRGIACAVCGTVVFVPASKAQIRQYCSPECSAEGRRKRPRPSPDRLADLIEKIGNFSELGRMFGVSDNAVRKWARRYGLDISHVDGRKRAA